MIPAQTFYHTFKIDHMDFHHSDVSKLSAITTPEHVQEHELAQTFRNNKYTVKLSRTVFDLLLNFLHDNNCGVIMRLTNAHLNVQVTSARPLKATTADLDDGVGISGYSKDQVDAYNAQPINTGQPPMDVTMREEVIHALKEEDAKDPDAEDLLVDDFNKIKPETPAEDGIQVRSTVPLPPYKGTDIRAEVDMIKETRKRMALGPQAALPSVCAYTLHNTYDIVNTMRFSEDATLMAAGTSDSYIKLWSLKGDKLRGLRSDFKPANISDASQLRKLREKHGSETRKLIGHSGAVYGLTFSADNQFMLSCSEDKTARLWSMSTYTNLVAYKGHNHPVWDIDLGPHGFYFATASHDRTARLWSCDRIYPLRIFAGHLSDVDCVKFHPNSMYVVTGSSDKTCRLWDVQRGSCVRVFTGHTGGVYTIAVSPDGKTMASAGEDGSIGLWDLGMGKRIKKMTGHKGMINTLSFSRETSVLVSGGADCTVRVWDVKSSGGQNEEAPPPTPKSAAAAADAIKRAKLEAKNQPGMGMSLESQRSVVESADLMATYYTKKTPVYNVQFTRRNLVMMGGAFMAS